MNRYQHNTLQPAIAGLAATFACAGTLAALVLWPATMPCDDTVLAKHQSAPIEVAIVPGRIDVIGVRERTTACEVPSATARQS